MSVKTSFNNFFGLFNSCCSSGKETRQELLVEELDEQKFKEKLEDNLDVIVLLEDGNKLSCLLHVNCETSLVRISCDKQVREIEFASVKKILHTKEELSRIQTNGNNMNFNTTVAFHLLENGLSNKSCGIKNPYYRKKGLWEWRRKLIYQMNKNRYRSKFITPKKVDKDEMPIKSKDSGHIWEFKVQDLPISLKRLKLYSKLLTNLHLQDAMDWLNSFPNIKTNRILNSLSESQKKIYEEYGGDPSRLYIDNMIINYGRPIKQLKHHALMNFGIMCTWRNSLVYKIREMPMNEFYQKIFILGKVPKSMSSELRNAIYDKRVDQQNTTKWFPYLTARSRFLFRKDLRYFNKIGQFDYYNHRRKWINEYNQNLERRVNLLKSRRGIKVDNM